MKISTKKIAISAMLIAFDVIFTRVLALNMPLTKIGLGFAAVMVCGMLYGPGWAALCAGLGDLVGSLLFPTGAYFPGFTVTAAIGGAILGAALYKKRLKLFALLFDGYGGETVMDFDIVQRLQFLLEHLIGEETVKQGRNSDFFADF